MTKQIAHFGTFDVQNFGDLLFPLILEHRLGDLGFEWIHVSPRGGAPVWRHCVPTTSVDALLKDPSNLAALVVGGGNIINCGATTLEDYQQGGLSATLAYPRLWLEPAYLAEQTRLPCWWNAPGVSESFSPELSSLVEWAATIPDYLSVRDPTSQGWLQDAGIKSTIHVVPDTALEISRLWADDEIETAHVKAFARCQRKVPARTVVFHLNDRFAREAPQVIAERLDRICEGFGATGILIALGPCHGDSELQRQVGGRMTTRPLVIDQPECLREVTACIARADAYIGSSLHGFIAACSFGRKAMVVVPHTAATAHKFSRFLESFSLTPWRRESWEDAEQGIDKLQAESPALWQRVLAAALPQLDAHWNQVRQLLTGRRHSEHVPITLRENQNVAVASGIPPATREAYSPPMQLVIHWQAARATDAVRALKNETQRRIQTRKALAAAEASRRSTEDELARIQMRLETLQIGYEASKSCLERARQNAEASLMEEKRKLCEVEDKLAELGKERKLREEYEAQLLELDRLHHRTQVSLSATEEALRLSRLEVGAVRERSESRQKDWQAQVEELTRAKSTLLAGFRESEQRYRDKELELTQFREEAAWRQLELEKRKEGLVQENARLAAQLADKTGAHPTALQNDMRVRKDNSIQPCVPLKDQLLHALKTKETAEARLSKAIKSVDYMRLILCVRNAVDAAVPPAASVTVISKGDDDLLKLGKRNAWHFPGDRRGKYTGYHPANGGEVLKLLKSQWMAGADYLVIPVIFSWWLDYYPELPQYLQTEASCLWRDERSVIYRLAPRPLAQMGVLLSQTLSRDKGKRRAKTGTGHKSDLRSPAIDVQRLKIANAFDPLDDAHYLEVVRGVQAAVDQWVPVDDVVAVVSKGDEHLVRFAHHRGWHFPQTEQGVYAGYHPGSDSDAIRHLEALRKKGAASLVIPRTAWWWFDHYHIFGTYLRTRYQCAGGDKNCFVFDLSPPFSRNKIRRVRNSVTAIACSPNTRASLVDQNTSFAKSSAAEIRPPDEPVEKPLHANLVTVIIPVYNAVHEVKLCLESLWQHTKHPHQVLLIDDCSPDPAVLPLLESFANSHPHIHVRHNPVNRGYTGTINLGCRVAPGDVVLLNSDTQVTPGWLDKLSACALSREHVATVTPLSNAAGAFSVPKNNYVNEIPAPLNIVDMGRLVERLSKKLRPAVPTGNGFCMYVTRRALNIIGKFDEKNFPRGYGEENDFCMRANAQGFVNLIDDSTFIHHRKGASFLESRTVLLNRSRDILRRLHPTYKQEVTEWLTNDPLDPLRSELQERLRAPASAISSGTAPPCLLSVIHDGKGGTLLTNADLMKEMANVYRCLVLKMALNQWTLHECHEGEFQPVRSYSFSLPWQVQYPLDGERRCVLEDICRSFDVSLVHVRHLLGGGPELLEAIHQLEIPVVMSFHDYFTVCPTIQLIDDRGIHCGGRCTSGSGNCNVARSWFRGEVPVMKHQFVYEHRRRMTEALRNCKCFVTTCESARQIIQDAFPILRNADFRIIEHGRDLPRRRLATTPRQDTAARVVCLGNIDRAKGCELIEKLMVLNKRTNERFEFHFVGNQSSAFKPSDFGGICHGPYQRDDLPDILKRIQPSFSLIASIWPETYCHTLTESWTAGLPVFASSLGALKERIQRHGGGWLLDPNDADGWFRGMVKVLNSPTAYLKVLEEVLAYRPKSVADMAKDYADIYGDLLKRSSQGHSEAIQSAFR